MQRKEEQRWHATIKEASEGRKTEWCASLNPWWGRHHGWAPMVAARAAATVLRWVQHGVWQLRNGLFPPIRQTLDRFSAVDL